MAHGKKIFFQRCDKRSRSRPFNEEWKDGSQQHYFENMAKLSRGIYQSIFTQALLQSLQDLDTRLTAKKTHLHQAEAADRLSMHLAKVIKNAIASIEDKDRVRIGGDLTQKLIQLLVESTDTEELLIQKLELPPRILNAIEGNKPDGSLDLITPPLIDLLDTTLLTNSPGEPRIGNQIITEIPSSNSIDLVMAFIRKSGIAPMMDALRIHRELGRPLRILTTTYTGSTEALALDMLHKIGANIKVSYDTTSTRLHAKAWLFKRHAGFSTAYIGSSNLTYSAQVNGLEWNVRFSGSRNPDVVDKVIAVFESYWNSGDFVTYDREQFLELTKKNLSFERQNFLSPIEIRLEPFQERLLEQIQMARQQGHHRNLLVSATGTGKTVMAAIDYSRLKARMPRSRLLFIAHRKEILEQSLATFRHAMRDQQFGEVWVDGRKPVLFEHVFASIQSLNAAGLNNLAAAHFDLVIVDEFHHAAASSYRKVLEYLKPVELLGLTATPERSDDLSILEYFDGRIAAELRLWDAIDRHRLAPFAYFGIHDGQDLSRLPFKRGIGYDIDALTNVYTANDVWVRLVVGELERRVDDIRQIRGLGFCVSVAHANFMADRFNALGIKSLAVWSETPPAERGEALSKLSRKEINLIFSVDLFNEGVDLPAVDTLLMLRPTESPTLFLQQLGRGLRHHKDKTICTVLDFVGRQHQDFRFDVKYRALLGGTRSQIIDQVENGFPYLPAGCHMVLDRVASGIVLKNIREAVPDRWPLKVQELRKLITNGSRISIGYYLKETGLDIDEIYKGDRSWTALCRSAGLATFNPGPNEETLLRAVGRLLHVDDPIRLAAYQRLVELERPPVMENLDATEQRYLRMIVATLVDQIADRDASIQNCLKLIWQNPQVRKELSEVFDLLKAKVSHLTQSEASLEVVPLAVHARYSRIEILAAFGVGKNVTTPPWQSGVYWADESKSDLLAFTLDKNTGHFSPTTRYKDYAISRDLIHWESQAVTRANSRTGQRYQNHLKDGSRVMLFTRVSSEERAFYFLGGASYVRHESEMPMAITWKLTHQLPGDLYVRFAAAVA
jgi:superfamily II DNA or RNA helicase/HKD family nuclease